jgi:hypothetical protein
MKTIVLILPVLMCLVPSGLAIVGAAQTHGTVSVTLYVIAAVCVVSACFCAWFGGATWQLEVFDEHR